jgi:hypothetical protein
MIKRPDVRLLLGMLLLCAFAAAVTGCADGNGKWLGGLAFDVAGIAIQGLAGN